MGLTTVKHEVHCLEDVFLALTAMGVHAWYEEYSGSVVAMKGDEEHLFTLLDA